MPYKLKSKNQNQCKLYQRRPAVQLDLVRYNVLFFVFPVYRYIMMMAVIMTSLNLTVFKLKFA